MVTPAYEMARWSTLADKDGKAKLQNGHQGSASDDAVTRGCAQHPLKLSKDVEHNL